MKEKNQFLQRILFSTLFSVIVFLAIFYSTDPIFAPFFVALIAGFIAISLWEYYQISKAHGFKPLISIGILGSIAYIASIFLTINPLASSFWPTIVLGTILFCAFLSYFFKGQRPLVNLAITMFGIIYLAVPIAYMIPINFELGRFWLVYLLVVTKLTDVGAYLVGRYFGRHHLAPIISPKKTWEGAFAGFISGTLASYALDKFSTYYFGSSLFDNPLQALAFGAIMSLVAQVGDLFESLLKRDSGVKDSNHLPGLGGLLDMLDSLIFTTPLLYFFIIHK